MADGERRRRRSLGIPPEAERVLIFAESSHWDPDWLHTSEVYYRRFVEQILDRALEELEREPRRVFSVESVFFLRMYWERRPGQRLRLAELINTRRLRLTNPAVTTADTIIPSPEALLRDFLVGQEWLRSQGLAQEPELAYFPDSFGGTPALPSILQAAGFRRTAITRIDGMYFPGFEFNNPRKYPRPGSNAELLLKRERTLDFVWRDAAGAEALCHWNAFSYGQGDLLAHRGVSRIYLFPLAVSDRSEHNVARRIRRYVSQLAPLSRTPYLFCPIGFDFLLPIPDLVSLLDRYNRTRYPDTGIWTLNAGLDDYLELVDGYRDRLPCLQLDPNPYWTGFYSSRPALKRRCHELVEQLCLAEKLSSLPANRAAAEAVNARLEPAWWIASISNHHDFITGTSNDHTVEQEQLPWLEAARRVARAAIDDLAATARPQAVIEDLAGAARPQPPAEQAGAPPDWERRGPILAIRTPFYALELDERRGGAIVEALEPDTGQALLGPLSNDLISYRTSGGLWRMGHEFEGGRWHPLSRASQAATSLEVDPGGGRLQIHWDGELDGESIERWAWFDAGSPVIRFRVEGRAARRRMVTVRFAPRLEPADLQMDVPGGVVSRPAHKIYAPTFWPFQRFLHLREDRSGRGLAVFQRWPGSAALRDDHDLELVALANAARERAYLIFPVSGHPASGYEKQRYRFDYALQFTRSGDWIDNQLPAIAYAELPMRWGNGGSAADMPAAALASVDRPDVWVVADKPASRGEGRVVRLYTLTAVGAPVELRLPQADVSAAYLCDGRERDLQALPFSSGTIRLRMPGTLCSVRWIGPGPSESKR